MGFVIDDAFLPATLTAQPMTDEEFAEFCAEHPDLFFEMTADGELIVMPPTYSGTGASNSASTPNCKVGPDEKAEGSCAILPRVLCCQTEPVDLRTLPGLSRAAFPVASGQPARILAPLPGFRD